MNDMMLYLLISVNVVFVLSILLYLYFRNMRKKYIIALGKFQSNLNKLVDFCDYLALQYGSSEQQSILLKVKMYAKMIKTLSNYWHYIDSLSSTITIFMGKIEDEQDEAYYRREFEKFLAHAKSSLVILQKTSQKVTKRSWYFAPLIVKIPFDLDPNKPLEGKTYFIANAINNLTYYRK